MAKTNVLTEQGQKVQKILTNARLELGLLHKDEPTAQVLEYLVDAVEMMLFSADPLWEKVGE
jgi:hypothetical protein